MKQSTGAANRGGAIRGAILGNSSGVSAEILIGAVLFCAFLYLGLFVLVECVGRAYLTLGGMPWNGALATYKNDDLLGYRPNPLFSLGKIRFNSLGFREERDFPAHPTPGVVRLLAVGGSTTFGHGVTESESFPSWLEADLNSRIGAAEVINAGVSGWQIFQIRHSLATWLDQIHPELVIISSSWNTGIEPYKYYRNDDSITYPLFEYSILFRLLDRQLRKTGYNLHYQPFLETRAELTHKQEKMNNNVAIFDQYERYVREIVEICQAKAAQPVFVIPPGNLPDAPGLPVEAYFDGTSFEERERDYELMCLAVNRTRDLSGRRIAVVERDLGLTVVDMRGILDHLTREERLALFNDEVHLTSEGNRLLGTHLGQRISSMLSP